MDITHTTTADQKPSYEVNTLRLNVGPLHQRLLGYYNEMHEAIASGDGDTVQELEEIVPPLLEEFEATECQTSVNPGWLAGKMRGGWHVARGDFNAALRFELNGYQHAAEEPDNRDNPIGKAHRRSVSASNIADQLWRLGRAREGLDWARISVELWPENTINHLVLAITAYRAGLRKEADQVLSKLRQVAEFGNEHDALSLCISFERELHGMTELPAVESLLRDMGGI